VTDETGPSPAALAPALDYEQILLDALAARGEHYRAASVSRNFQSPPVPLAGGGVARFTDRDVVLVRAGEPASAVAVSNPRSGLYQARIPLPNPLLGNLSVVRGWAWVDVKVRGKSFRFVDTHLEAFSAAVRAQQAVELVNASRRADGWCELARPVGRVFDPSWASKRPARRRTEMYAVLRLNSFDPAKLAASGEKLEEFDRVHAAQPGYVGSVVVDLGESRRFVLNLWESEQHSTSALSVLGSEVQRLLVPLLSSPSELIGVGTVLSSDLAPSTDGR
jgi:hypothetical protein